MYSDEGKHGDHQLSWFLFTIVQVSVKMSRISAVDYEKGKKDCIAFLTVSHINPQ